MPFVPAIQDMPSIINHILVVEDHADSAAMLSRLLKRCGYAVSIAGRVSEALAAISENIQAGSPVDLLVSDLGLPDGTGFQLMRKVRDEFRLPGIALSGYGQSNDVKTALESGFSVHLTKPIDFDRLKATILQLGQQGAEVA